MSNNSSPSRNSNPFSARISSLLQLRRQIAQEQEDLSHKIQQDLQRLDSIQSQANKPSLREIFSEMDGVEVQNGPQPTLDIDWNDPDDIELYCEPECPWDRAASETSESNGMDENKYESTSDEDMADLNEDDLSNKFAVSLDIYNKVSFNHFNFHEWLREFDLICIKEILVFRGLQLKDSWTKENFKIILSHPLIKRDEKLLSQIESMLNVFESVKRRDLTGKGVWADDTDDDEDDNTDTERPSFISALCQNHFANLANPDRSDANLIPFKGLTFKLNEPSPTPPLPPTPINNILKYHFQ